MNVALTPPTAPNGNHAPLSRPAIPMGTNPPGSGSPVAELGHVANWLRRTYMETYQAPGDDPIHGHVEAVRAHESIALHLVAAMRERSQTEADTVTTFAELKRQWLEEVADLRAAVGREATQERDNLRKDATALGEKAATLTTAVTDCAGKFGDIKPLIADIPEYQKVLQDDVNARARERWGQGVTLILGVMAGVIVGAIMVSYVFYHFVLSRAIQP